MGLVVRRNYAGCLVIFRNGGDNFDGEKGVAGVEGGVPLCNTPVLKIYCKSCWVL